MANKSNQTFRLSYPSDVVLKVVTNGDFLVENFKLQDNPAAEVKERSRTADRLLLDCKVTEYEKGMTGVNRNKTEITETFYDWDLKGRKATWTYKSSHERVKVWGSTRIDDAGGSAVLHEEFNVDVKIPLVGGKAEKIILKEVGKYWPRYEQLLKDWCEKLK